MAPELFVQKLAPELLATAAFFSANIGANAVLRPTSANDAEPVFGWPLRGEACISIPTWGRYRSGDMATTTAESTPDGLDRAKLPQTDPFGSLHMARSMARVALIGSDQPPMYGLRLK